MTRRVILSLVAGLLGFAVLVAADDPAGEDPEPPVRLKKKSRPPADAPKEDPPAEKPAGPKDRPPEPRSLPEDPPPADVDEQELLNRVSRNMRTSEDRLANKELGEGTHQVQRDIVDDLDKLINKMSQPQPNDNSGGSPSASSGAQKQRGQQAGSARRSSSKQAARGQGQNPSGQPRLQGGRPQNSTAGAGNNPGAGNDRSEGANRLNDVYKHDIWGHLPETLRAEMNAYSRQEYMAKYADIIKQYYSTVAEKGRKKGD